MHESPYKNMMDENLPFYDLYQNDYVRRLEFARDNGCNTVMLTGNSEPQQNRNFLQTFGTLNAFLRKPFRWIEMQTTGVILDEPYLRFLRNHVGVSTISVSMSAFDDDKNKEYNGTPDNLKVNLRSLCSAIKKYDFNLRISVNLTDYFTDRTPFDILSFARNELNADQVTFRVLYTSTADKSRQTAQDIWIEEHRASDKTISEIAQYVTDKGRALEKLEFGAVKYSVMGMSTVVDNDCMSTEVKESVKYVILQPNCKLYSKWDDPASLVF
jgi:hypothetical protein